MAAAAAAAAVVFGAAGNKMGSSEAAVAQDLPDFAASMAYRTGCLGSRPLSADCCSMAAG